MKAIGKFLLPWRVEGEQEFYVFDANGHVIYSHGTFCGDGDGEINLSKYEWECIVDAVNKSDMTK